MLRYDVLFAHCIGEAYITPPGAFTHFHQDGNGTVDSAHIVLEGYNEVVMLRRLPEEHKWRAVSILTGLNAVDKIYRHLYEEPHDDLGELPKWPTYQQIKECRRMGCVELDLIFSLAPRRCSNLFCSPSGTILRSLW
jgi:hypothetical protein